MRPPALALTSLAAALLFAGTARAEDDELADALAAFASAEKELATSAPCDTMCKALQSMIRAADRICELARDGTATEQKRCTDAKTKVAEATARVRASCPSCDPSPPYAPSTTPQPKPTTVAPGGDVKPVPAAAPMHEPAPKDEAAYAASDAGLARRATTTVSLDVLPLFAPPWIIQPRLEKSIARRFSISVVGSIGTLPKTGPNGAGHTGVIGVGGEGRAYVVGTFDRFGLFLGANFTYRSASTLDDVEHLVGRGFPLGLTATALVGTKVVFAGGLTLEARVGPSFVLDDHRNAGPREKVLPSGAFSFGWTF